MAIRASWCCGPSFRRPYHVKMKSTDLAFTETPDRMTRAVNSPGWSEVGRLHLDMVRAGPPTLLHASSYARVAACARSQRRHWGSPSEVLGCLEVSLGLGLGLGLGLQSARVRVRASYCDRSAQTYSYLSPSPVRNQQKSHSRDP